MATPASRPRRGLRDQRGTGNAGHVPAGRRADPGAAVKTAGARRCAVEIREIMPDSELTAILHQADRRRRRPATLRPEVQTSERRATDVKLLQVRLAGRMLSVPVRGFSRFRRCRYGHIVDRAGHSLIVKEAWPVQRLFRWSGQSGL
jgi:hypothetical protein